MGLLYLVGRGPDADTVSVLRALLADALAGKVIGIAVTYRMRGGYEETAHTGPYWERPSEALLAAVRTSLSLSQRDPP